MKQINPKTRLFVNFPLQKNSYHLLNIQQTHYLAHVLRLKVGENIFVFNGIDGEWLAQLTMLNKKILEIKLLECCKEQKYENDVQMCFSPLKKTHTDILVAQATELGVTHFLPILTEHSHTKRINTERLSATAIEAAELSERLDIPKFSEIQPLTKLLINWPEDRYLFFCDEAREDSHLLSILEKHKKNGTLKSKIAFLIGPEGGFSTQERAFIKKQPFTITVQLGQRIMRADTAAITALSTWHAFITIS